MSKKKNRRVIPKVNEKTTFVEAVRQTKISRKTLFVILFTGFLVLYGVFTVFAAGLSGPTEAAAETVDSAVQTAGSEGTDLGGGSSGCACCGGQQEEIKDTATINGDVQEITVQVAGGYDPNVIEIKKGIPLRITFERHSTSGCDQQVVFSEQNIYKNLPDDGKVTLSIDIPDEAGQTIDFACGMNMLRGQLRVVD